jgi:hypothetical protein
MVEENRIRNKNCSPEEATVRFLFRERDMMGKPGLEESARGMYHEAVCNFDNKKAVCFGIMLL